MIRYASQIRAVQDSGRKTAMKPAFVTTRLCRAPALHIASDNAIMCDMLTHCKVYAGLQMRRATSLSHAVLLPVYALFVTIMLRTRTQPALAFQHQQATLTFNRLSIRSALALLSLYPTWKRVSSSLDSRLPDIKQFQRTSYTKIPQGLTTSSSSLVDRWMRSILTRSHTLA